MPATPTREEPWGQTVARVLLPRASSLASRAPDALRTRAIQSI
jgi:hypothetical protein